MIQPLRKIHRRIFFLLLALLPLVFVAGLLARHHWPATNAHVSAGGRP
jgi:hypothetical protein